MSTLKTFGAAPYVAVCVVAALSFGASAHATDVISTGERAQTTIQYSDLDLSKEADALTLYGRLQRASDKVCGEYKDLRNLRMKRVYDACYQDTLARAVDSVGHAAVKAVYASDSRVRVAGQSVKTQSST